MYSDPVEHAGECETPQPRRVSVRQFSDQKKRGSPPHGTATTEKASCGSYKTVPSKEAVTNVKTSLVSGKIGFNK